MEVELRSRISEIEEAEWDELAGNEILARHAWLATVEESLSVPAEFIYFLVRDSGRLVGAAAGHVTGASASAQLNQFYGRAAPLARVAGLGFDRALVVGSRFGMVDPLLFRDELAQSARREVARELTNAIRIQAEQRSAVVMVRNGDDEVYTALFREESFEPTPEMPSAYLNIVWDTVAEYRAALKKVHPATSKAMRNVQNRAIRDGVTLERITDPQSCTPELHKLFDDHYRRLNGTGFPFSASFLANALNRLGKQALLIVARDPGGIIGVDFRLTYGGRSRSMLIGIDEERGKASTAYFHLINDSISRAIESKQRRLYAGRLVYDVKLRRGYSLETSTMWIRGRTRLQRAVLKPFIALRTRLLMRTITKLQHEAAQNAATMSRAGTETNPSL